MTADGFKAVLAELGLNQTTGAAFLGIGDRTSRRYASGEIEIPEATAMLLLLMAKTKTTPKRALALLNPGKEEP